MLQSRVLGGLNAGEISLTALLFVIVLIAPKVGRVGETIGSWFEGRGARDDRSQKSGDARE
jgi:hypothetical protein